MKKEALHIPPAMSDEAVQSKTGKNWSEWFSLLDKAGAAKMNHRDIVAHLSTVHKVGSWWRQMVAVTYEKARGLRDDHQKPEGYQISVSRTYPQPVPKLYSFCLDEKNRKKWLEGKETTLRKANENKSIRFNWVDQKTILEFRFYPKGEAKSQLTVQHDKLPDSKAADSMKAYWGKALDKFMDHF